MSIKPHQQIGMYSRTHTHYGLFM